MAPVLTHPTTGRKVTVTDKQAGVYTDNGWTEVGPVRGAAKGKGKEGSADGAGTAGRKSTAGKDSKAD